MSGLSQDDLEAVLAYDVSRETIAGLQLFADELMRWQRIKNLVSPGTLDQIWSRHVLDSLQLLDLAPGRNRWLDLGSGAGFPGLVVAIAGQQHGGWHVDLVESNVRKCAFLQHVARLTKAPVTVHRTRIEAVVDGFHGRTDVVTARALAPLDQLLRWTHSLIATGSIGLFPKGKGVAAELTQAEKSWIFKAELIPSRTDPAGRIVRVTSVEERGKP